MIGHRPTDVVETKNYIVLILNMYSFWILEVLWQTITRSFLFKNLWSSPLLWYEKNCCFSFYMERLFSSFVVDKLLYNYGTSTFFLNTTIWILDTSSES